jgi:hypothetical protein
MDIKLEFAPNSTSSQPDTYRLTFEGKIQPIFQKLFLQGFFKQVQPNIFEAPVSRIKSLYNDELDFVGFCIQLAEDCRQQDYKLELVSSISKTDYERLSNLWVYYGIFAVTEPGYLIPSDLVPFFSLRNYNSPQQSKPDNQRLVLNYMTENNLIGSSTLSRVNARKIKL